MPKIYENVKTVAVIFAIWEKFGEKEPYLPFFRRL